MANSASHTASSAERRGWKLATLFLRVKKSYGRLTARSTSWAQSQGWPAWVGKVPIIAVGTLLFAVSLFSILALAAVAILGIAFFIVMGLAKKENSVQGSSAFFTSDSSSSYSQSDHDYGYQHGSSGYGYYEDGVKIHD